MREWGLFSAPHSLFPIFLYQVFLSDGRNDKQ